MMDPPSSKEDDEYYASAAAGNNKNKPSASAMAAAADFLSQPYPQKRTSSLRFEDEEEEDETNSYEDDDDEDRVSSGYLSANEGGSNSSGERERAFSSIRQEALKVLEVADDQLAGSSYSVYRTKTGGFMASAAGSGTSGGNNKRVPSALSGLKYTATRTKSYNYRDDPYATSDGDNGVASPNTVRDDCEYGDKEEVLDHMERRRSESSSGSKWSSRYSVDNSLLAMAGGGGGRASTRPGSSSRILEDLSRDARDRRAARNLFGSAPSAAQDAGVFGTGAFNFRQQYVFGRQGVTVADQQQKNLYEGHSLPPASPRKSWQEQRDAKVRKRRRILILVSVVAFVFVVTLATAISKKKRDASSVASSSVGNTIPTDTLTFYVTSDIPFDSDAEQKLADDLGRLDPDETKFLVHLGNLQRADTTACDPDRYREVADLIEKSSPVAAFVLPGKEDWADCPDPMAAFAAWDSAFAYFETTFDHDMEVGRQLERLENFAFRESGVLILGVHVIGGRLYSAEENRIRNADNLNWIRNMTEDLGPESRAIVVLGNDRPGLPQNQDFFDEMSGFLQSYGLPAMYVHSNSGMGGFQEYAPFSNAGNVLAIQVPHGGKNPPTRITVGTGSRLFFVQP